MFIQVCACVYKKVAIAEANAHKGRPLVPRVSVLTLLKDAPETSGNEVDLVRIPHMFLKYIYNFKS